MRLPLTIYATAPVRHALTAGIALAPTLACSCGTTWREPSGELTYLLYADGAPSGLSYAAFPVVGKPPRYMERRAQPQAGDRFVDERTGGRLLPGVASLDEGVRVQLQAAMYSCWMAPSGVKMRCGKCSLGHRERRTWAMCR